jgi:gliding motility associated protien GldN
MYMKKLLILSSVLIVGLVSTNSADAQFRKKTTPGQPGTTNPTPTNPQPGTTKPAPAGSTKPVKTIDTARSNTGKEFGGTVKPSLRNVFGFDNKNTLVKDRQPLAYEHLREDDIMFSHFIWREIDAREKMNKVFSYPAKENGEDQRFMAIILDAIKNDSVMAFSAEDDRFTTPLGYDTLMSVISSAGNDFDTVYAPNVNDPNIYDTIIQRRNNPFAPKPDSIYTFRILEQVMFDKESSRLFTRILGIAPVAKIGAPTGTPGGIKSTSKTLFWIYYPDLRPKLAKTFAYNTKNANGRMTWEEIFESRFFSSYIVKSSMDNPTDQRLADLIKDPLFRLLEGENIKEKIFNYEQNLWAY